jgi:uncharacterized protein YdaU (DUF1376 family)
MSAGRPWYKRYPADYLHATMQLNVAQKGAYGVALDLMYERGGPIADDARYLARMCGCTMQTWRRLRAELIEHGKLTITEDGMLSNGRMLRELLKQRDDGKELSEAGRRGGLRTQAARRAADRVPASEPITSKKPGKFFAKNFEKTSPVSSSESNDINDMTTKRLGEFNQAGSETQIDRSPAPSESSTKKQQSPAATAARAREPKPAALFDDDPSPPKPVQPTPRKQAADKGSVRHRAASLNGNGSGRYGGLDALVVQCSDGLPAVKGFYLDATERRVHEAARTDSAHYHSDIGPLIRWMSEGIEPSTIFAAIERVANRPRYLVPDKLSYFDGPVREEHGRQPVHVVPRHAPAYRGGL